jgi:hypothetical protein
VTDSAGKTREFPKNKVKNAELLGIKSEKTGLRDLVKGPAANDKTQNVAESLS